MAGLNAKASVDYKGYAQVCQRLSRLMALAIRQTDVKNGGGRRVFLQKQICLGTTATVKPASESAHSRSKAIKASSSATKTKGLSMLSTFINLA